MLVVVARQLARLRQATVDRVRSGAGQSTLADRDAAYRNSLPVAHPAAALIDKVARNAYKVTDEDVAGVLAAGLAEDQVYELVIAAALGQADRQLASAEAALAEALETP
jgi:hypothetical protein